MITIKDWIETINYRISEGSGYGWQCYGPNAYSLGSWDGDHNGASSNIIFDTKTQVIYEAEVHDYKNERSYRLINPIYRAQFESESVKRGVDASMAYDNVKYIDLETAEDFITKCRAIMNYQDYDRRVSVPVELTDKEMFKLMVTAHECDVTLNQLVEKLLLDTIKDFKRDPEGTERKYKEFLNDKNLVEQERYY